MKIEKDYMSSSIATADSSPFAAVFFLAPPRREKMPTVIHNFFFKIEEGLSLIVLAPDQLHSSSTS
ncbi:hypothetical protein LguiA_002978 [Lonicera macranthoides]